MAVVQKTTRLHEDRLKAFRIILPRDKQTDTGKNITSLAQR